MEAAKDHAFTPPPRASNPAPFILGATACSSGPRRSRPSVGGRTSPPRRPPARAAAARACGPQHEAEAIAVAQPCQRRWRGAQDLHALAGALRARAPVAPRLRGPRAPRWRRRAPAPGAKTAGSRAPRGRASSLLDEARHVVLERRTRSRGGRGGGSGSARARARRRARRGPPPAPAAESVRSAARKSGIDKRGVGVEHADQRHAREVVALGHHLRADQDVDLAARACASSMRVALGARRHVAIEPRDARAGKRLRQRFSMRSVPAPSSLSSVACTCVAASRTRRRVVAVVADQLFAARCDAASSATEQFGHSDDCARKLSQTTLGAKPRRFRNRIACSLRARARARARGTAAALSSRSPVGPGADPAQVDDLDRAARPRARCARSGSAGARACLRAHSATALERRRRRAEHAHRAARGARAAAPCRARGSARPLPA